MNEPSDPGALALSGYASVFGVTDHSGDIVVAGAFARSLAAGGSGRIRMLFQHEAGEPVGVWDEMFEDARGLFVRGRILSAGPRSRAARSLVAQGAVDGLSIGFRTVRSRPRPGGGRVLTELDLWEVSIVTFPMLGTARLTVHAPARQPGPQAAHAA